MVTGLDQLKAVKSKVISINKNSNPSAVGQTVEVKRCDLSAGFPRRAQAHLRKCLWIRSDGGQPYSAVRRRSLRLTVGQPTG